MRSLPFAVQGLRRARSSLLVVLALVACDSMGPDVAPLSPITLINRSNVPVSFAAYEQELANRADFTGYRILGPDDTVVQPGDSAWILPAEIEGYTTGASVFLLLYEARDGEAFSVTADRHSLWYVRLSLAELKERRFRVEVRRQ